MDIEPFAAITPYNSRHTGDEIDNAVDEIPKLKDELSDIQYLIGYTDDDIYGVEVDFENSRVTRLAGAENRTAGEMFDGIYAFGGRRRCIVADDGAILAYFGDEAYTETGVLETSVWLNGKTYPAGEFAQVMVYQPKFYYKSIPLKLEKVENSPGYHVRKIRYYVSDTPKNGFKVHPAFIKNGTEFPYVLIGAFEGCAYDVSEGHYNLDDVGNTDFTQSTGDKLSSVANALPVSGATQPLTRRNCGIIAENRGHGWSQMYAAILACTQLLFIIEYASLNSQDSIGKGVSYKDSGTDGRERTGQTSNLGSKTGMAEGVNGLVPVSYRGVENPWGNTFEFIDGINVWGDGRVRGGMLYIADHGFEEDKRTENYKNAGFSLSGNSGYISAICYGTPEFDWLFMPSEMSGNSSVPVGDFCWMAASLTWPCIAMSSDCYSGNDYCGLFSYSLNVDFGGRAPYFGGRLVYTPVNGVEHA